jgi:hypothetical protein
MRSRPVRGPKNGVASGQQCLAFAGIGPQHEQWDGLVGRVRHGHEQAERAAGGSGDAGQYRS